jgi:hypothetical protein
MHRPCKSLLSVLVWLAAAMSVAAGMPHSTCRCPDGHVKLFCSGSAGKGRGCCCDRACCGKGVGATCCCRKARAGTRGVTASCCGAYGQAAEAPSSPGPAFTGACCKRTLVQSKASTFRHLERFAFQDTTPGALLHLHHAPAWDTPAEPCRFRPEHQRPPPTDLLATLQHLLI